MRIFLAIITTLVMAFTGVIIGIGLDGYFGGATISFSPILSVVFAVATMGAFIINAIQNNQ